MRIPRPAPRAPTATSHPAEQATNMSSVAAHLSLARLPPCAPIILSLNLRPGMLDLYMNGVAVARAPEEMNRRVGA